MWERKLLVQSSQQEFFPLSLLTSLTRPCNNQFQSEVTVVMVTLTWAWWSWLAREYIPLYFLVPFTLCQPAVAWEDGTVPISRSYFHLFHKDALPISFAVVANAQSLNLKEGNITWCYYNEVW